MKNTFLIIGIMICIALSVPTTINATDNKINNKSEAVKADDMENMTKSDQMQFEKQLLKTKVENNMTFEEQLKYYSIEKVSRLFHKTFLTSTNIIIGTPEYSEYISYLLLNDNNAWNSKKYGKILRVYAAAYSNAVEGSTAVKRGNLPEELNGKTLWEYAKETGELRVGVNKSALTTKANNIADINILSRFEVYAKAAYSPERAVKYAAMYNEKSTKKDGHKADRNGAYKSFPNGDCTNYVSQCVNYAGKNMQPKKLPVKQECTDNLKYWFNKKYTYKINGEKKKLFKYSTSFVRVGDFYKYWGQKRGYKIDGTYWDTDKNSKLQRVLKLGDIVQVHEFLGGWHHSIIITGGKQGDWKYSGHTHDRYNKRVSTLSESPTTYYRVIRIR